MLLSKGNIIINSPNVYYYICENCNFLNVTWVTRIINIVVTYYTHLS